MRPTLFSGMSLPFVGALLGHREVATTNRYSHLMNDPLKQAAEKVATGLDPALKTPPRRPAEIVKLDKRA